MKPVLLLIAIVFSVTAAATDYKCVKGNCRDGWSRRTYGDSEYYEGNFKNGQFEGKGTFENNEIKYTGNWKDGWYDGEGTLIHKQSGAGRAFPEDIKTGTFSMGKLNGQGTHVSYSLSYGKQPDTMFVWKGTFKDDALSGSGSMLIHHMTTYFSDSWTGDYTFNKGYELRYNNGQRNEGSMTQTGLFINAANPSGIVTTTTTTTSTTSSSSASSSTPASGGSMLDYGIFNTHQKKLSNSYAPENATQYSGSNNTSTTQAQKTDRWSTCSCCGGKGYTETYVQGNSYQIKDRYGNNTGTTSFQRTTCSCCHGTGK